MPRSTFNESYKMLISHLVELRKAHGLTQVELAKRIEKPQQFVSAFERRARRLDVVELYAVVKAIGGDPERIVSDFYWRLPEHVDI